MTTGGLRRRQCVIETTTVMTHRRLGFRRNGNRSVLPSATRTRTSIHDTNSRRTDVFLTRSRVSAGGTSLSTISEEVVMSESVLARGSNNLRNYACRDCKVPMGNVLPTRSGFRLRCSCCRITLLVCTKVQPYTLRWRPAAAPG